MSSLGSVNVGECSFHWLSVVLSLAVVLPVCWFERNLRAIFGYSIRIDLAKAVWLSIYAFVRSTLRASSLPGVKYFLYSATSLSVKGDVVRSS